MIRIDLFWILVDVVSIPVRLEHKKICEMGPKKINKWELKKGKLRGTQ